MNKKITLLIIFIAVALIQLYVPAKMIWDKEEVMASGKEFKFRTAPVDPYDPFRGRFIVLRYDGNSFAIEDEEQWHYGDNVYVEINTDQEGYAKVKSVAKEAPTDDIDYVVAKVNGVYGGHVTFEYPFDRYYMEESKAYDAELLYNRLQRDSSKVAYALVSIKNGDAVLKDVMIDDRSIKDIVEEVLEKEKSEF